MLSVLGRYRAGFYLELLQGIGKRQGKIRIAEGIVMSSSIQEERQAIIQTATDGNKIRRPGPCRSLITTSDRGAGKNNQIRNLAPIERQLQDAHVIDHLADTRAPRLDQSRICLDLDLFTNLADLQADVDDWITADLQNDARL